MLVARAVAREAKPQGNPNAQTRPEQTYYVYDMAGQRITTVTEQGPWRCRYLHADLVESCRLETSQNGDVIAYEQYHPFGTSAYQATYATLGRLRAATATQARNGTRRAAFATLGHRLNFSQAVCVPAGYDGRQARPYPNIGRTAGSLA